MSDVAFTFDNTSFLKGAKQIEHAFKNMNKAFKSFIEFQNASAPEAEKNNKQIAEAAERAAGAGVGRGPQGIEKRMTTMTQKMRDFFVTTASALVTFAAIGKVARKLWDVFKSGVPEVTSSFGAVKDIFMKNFFYPIRQFILPYLQKILDWTRDHRALFVQWGQTAVNILKVVGTILKPVWEGFKMLFNLNSGEFTKQINLVLAKVAIAATFVTYAIKQAMANVFPDINNILQLLAKLAVQAATGYGADVLVTLANAIHTLDKALSEIIADVPATSMQGFIEMLLSFTKLGLIINTIGVLTAGLNALLDVIDALKGKKVDWSNVVTPITQTPLSMGIQRTFFGGTVEEAQQKMKEDQAVVSYLQSHPLATEAEARKAVNVQDVIITKKGDLIRPDVNDTIIATKNPAAIGGGNMTMTVYLNVTEGNARRAGEEFTAGMGSGLRRMLLDRMQNGGRN